MRDIKEQLKEILKEIKNEDCDVCVVDETPTIIIENINIYLGSD